MTAYMVAQVDVTDPVAYDEYKAQVPATLVPFGGQFIVRGGPIDVLEGEMPFGRVAVIRFPSMEQLKDWHASVEYAGPKALRQAASKGLLVALEGYDG